MGFLSFLFAAPKALDVADKILDNASAGIDKLFFTAEEKSEASLKAVELWLEAQKITRDESTARSITRRVLAFMIMGTNLVMALGACVIYKFDVTWAMFIIAMMKELGFMTGAVAVFYFGYYGYKQIVGEKK